MTVVAMQTRMTLGDYLDWAASHCVHCHAPTAEATHIASGQAQCATLVAHPHLDLRVCHDITCTLADVARPLLTGPYQPTPTPQLARIRHDLCTEQQAATRERPEGETGATSDPPGSDRSAPPGGEGEVQAGTPRRPVDPAVARLERFAHRLFSQALIEQRAGELVTCLLNGGSATIDADTGKLVIVTAQQLGEMRSTDG